MRGHRTSALLLGIGLLVPSLAGAQIFVYPQRGQSAEQQNRDQGECHTWAIQQSGFNPGAPPPPAGSSGGMIQGGARGAAVGAVTGAIMGNAGRGAAAGAAGGALIGGMRQADQRRAQQAAQNQGQQAYLSAFRACMSGRGYSVN
jgi:hypothetical protein